MIGRQATLANDPPPGRSLSMNVHLDRMNIRLGYGHPLVLTDASGTLVHCVEGRLWITQHDDRRDIALQKGDSFTLDRPGRAVISTPADAELRLQVERPASGGEQLVAPLAKWFESIRLRLPEGSVGIA
jgi:hypothetical protein